jgi:hypothetical protein
MRSADFFQHSLDLPGPAGSAKPEKAGDRHRNSAVDIETLGNIADRKPRAAANLTSVGCDEAEQNANEGCLSCAVRTDESYDFASADIEIDALENDPPGAGKP